MIELFQESIRLVNLPFTLLAGVAVLYWAMVVFGMADLDVVDMDFDFDTDIDVDADAPGGSFLGVLLGILGLKNVPIMLALSIYFISLWAVGVLAQHYLNPGQLPLLSAGIIVGNLVLSLFVMRVVTRPFARLYGILNKDYDAPDKVIGSLCVVTSLELSEKIGSCEIEAKGAPIQLNAVHRGGKVLKKGDEALVVKYDKENRVYEIEPINLED